MPSEAVPIIVVGPKEREDVYAKLKSHFTLIGSAPCSYFPGYPFKFKDGAERIVSVSAVIEHFEKEQQAALVKSFKRFFKRANESTRFKCGIFQPALCWMLKASPLLLCSSKGGIQFEANEIFKSESVMQA
jgi:hypothetical protein